MLKLQIFMWNCGVPSSRNLNWKLLCPQEVWAQRSNMFGPCIHDDVWIHDVGILRAAMWAGHVLLYKQARVAVYHFASTPTRGTL